VRRGHAEQQAARSRYGRKFGMHTPVLEACLVGSRETCETDAYNRVLRQRGDKEYERAEQVRTVVLRVALILVREALHSRPVEECLFLLNFTARVC